MVNVSADVDGKVDRIYVEENQHVKAGDVLFRIDPAPYEVAVHEAEAALLQARAQVEALKATYAQKQAALRSTQARSEEHTSELQSLMRISYAVFCFQKKKQKT